MDLKTTFQAATSCKSVKISALEVERKYQIIRAERVETKFGQSVLLNILDSPIKTIKIYLPKSYSAVLTDVDIDDINTKGVSLHLIYKGTCVKTKSYIFAIK